jgi:tRNA-guanine family transglycosylase
MFAVIQGGKVPQERIKSCQQTVAKGHAAGYVFGGIGLDETPEQRQAMVSLMLKELPSDKPRAVIGIGHPCEVLDAVAMGIDLFSNTYPNVMSEMGYALTFNLDSDQSTASVKLNLRDKSYQLDTRPLIPHGCNCYTCTRHTRAYIHHLLNTYEMLANILLMMYVHLS